MAQRDPPSGGEPHHDVRVGATTRKVRRREFDLQVVADQVPIWLVRAEGHDLKTVRLRRFPKRPRVDAIGILTDRCRSRNEPIATFTRARRGLLHGAHRQIYTATFRGCGGGAVLWRRRPPSRRGLPRSTCSSCRLLAPPRSRPGEKDSSKSGSVCETAASSLPATSAERWLADSLDVSRRPVGD
jgi:hypothetical protein